MFIHHLFADKEEIPEAGPYLYEYVIGANGIFVRARRPGLEALIWVASSEDKIRGLAEVKPFVNLSSRVPRIQMARMFEMSIRANTNEILFYLNPDPWHISVPNQVQTGASVHPVDPFAGGTQTLIEVHSHHHMKTFFSGTDNREEQAGFRIYSVIGDLANEPTILTRVGIYGHFWEIPSSWVYDLPSGVKDGLFANEFYEVEYVDD